MRLKDLTVICIHNLFRHKSRTILTVLGVIVGCCSVVIMISFGTAMKISQESMLAEMGDLTVIDVYLNRDDIKLTDSVVESIDAMDKVKCVSPKVNLEIQNSITTGQGDRYISNYNNISGLKKEAVDNFGYKILSGENFKGEPMEALVGKYFIYTLIDTQRPEGNNIINYWEYMDENGFVDYENMPKPYVDPLNSVFKLTLGNSETEKTLTKEFKITGILDEDYSKGYETIEGLIFKADDIKKLKKEFYRLNNNPQADNSYSQISVKVNKIEDVAEVENRIKEMGFYTSSLESIREPMEKEVRQKQLMFAGLGTVSLFVAALGIMNTMIMSISERKKEIGVMKALGCFLKNIRTMFLMEAGFMGLIGGIAGSLISLAISGVINIVSTENEITDFQILKQVLLTNTDRVSVIPVWLAISAVVFSVLVGVVSGLYPANKAIKISALEAIKSD